MRRKAWVAWQKEHCVSYFPEVSFSLYKQSTILRRIEKRTVIHQIKGLTDYVSYLRHNPQEIDVLFKELLIRVTNFFRDSDAFDAFRREALPLVTRDKSFGNPLRVWVPGCSTGGFDRYSGN